MRIHPTFVPHSSFTAHGLFVGQSKEFFKVVNQLAEAADAATRQA